MTKNKIQFSKVDVCPECFRKLCKRKMIAGDMCIEYRHRGALVFGKDMIIQCFDCKRKYEISAKDGLIDEVNFGND